MSVEKRDQVVVITGASSGFGKGLALRLAEQGAAVVLAARRSALLEQVAVECEAMGTMSLPVPTDVSIQDDVERLAQAAISTFGRIDVWVNNAGVAAIGRFEESPLADHVQVIQTDLIGAIFGSFFALQQFRIQTYGTLINVASVLGKIPAPYYASYAAAKHGVVGLSGALRQELRQNQEEKIHVCTVLPMAMDTPFFEHAANYTGHEATPVPPVGDPKTVIDAIVELMDRPEDEVMVGSGGRMTAMAYNLFPSLIEGMVAKQTHHSQIEEAPYAELTTGGVRQPVESGSGTSGTTSKAK